MSELSDFIASYPAERLAAELEANNTDGWKVFNLLWNEPSDLIGVVDKLGLTTLQQFGEWFGQLEAVMAGKGDAIAAMVDPPLSFTYDSITNTTTMPEIVAAINAQCKLRDDLFFDQYDASYRLPTFEQITELAQKNPHRWNTWAAERMDCDDFCKAMLGWLAAKGLGNLAIGACTITIYRAGQILGGHAVLIAVDADMKVWLVEPQNGRVYHPTFPIWAGMFGDEIKIARYYI